MAYVERILLVIAVAALGWYATARASTMLYQASQHRQFEQLRLERGDISLPAPASQGSGSPSPDSPSPRSMLPGARSADASPGVDTGRAAETPRAPVDSRPRAAHGLIGRLQIPRLGVSAIVREGVDDRTLRRAVGHVPETARPGSPGNVALAAHRDTFFRPLRQIRIGDRIRVSTPERDFDYIVSETRIVGPDEVSVLDPTEEPALTLITCYPFDMTGPAPDRFIVRARAIDAVPAGGR